MIKFASQFLITSPWHFKSLSKIKTIFLMRYRNFILNAFFIFFAQYLSAQENHFTDESTRHYCACEETGVFADSSDLLNPGKKVLETGFKMALIDKTIIKGSCWDFVNEVYRRSGVDEKKTAVFRSQKKGPYANANMVKPGDWVYHINYQYNNIEHSAIFVCWKDFKNRIAITLSYAGGNRNLPGKYGEYKLSSIYSILRPVFNLSP